MTEGTRSSFIKKEALIFLFLAALVIAAFASPLFEGKLFFDSDTTNEDYPLYTFYAKALRTGEPFWWNPSYLMGYPSYVSAAFNMLDPVNLALFRLIENPLTAHTVRVAVDYIFSLWLGYAFARRTGLTRLPSIVVTLGYLVGFSLPHTTQNLMGSGSTFVLPGLLLLVYNLRFSERRWLWVILGGIFWGFSWLHAFANYVFNFSAVAYLFALYLDIAYPKIPGWGVRRFGTLILTAGASIMGIVIGLPFILPAMILRPLTRRVAGFGLTDLGGIAVADVLNFFFPDYIRIPMLSSSGALYGFYIGGFGLITAGLGFIAMRAKERLWYGGMYLLTLALTIKPLGLSWLLLHIPVFSYFHTMRRWLLIGIFFLAYAAGYGLEAILADEKFRQSAAFRRYMIGAFIVAGVVVLGVVIVNLGFLLLPWNDPVWLTSLFTKLSGFISITGSYPEEYYVAVLAKILNQIRASFSVTNWMFVLPLILFLTSLAFIARFWKEKISYRNFTIIGLVIISANFVSYYALQRPLLIDRREYENPPNLVKTLQKYEPDTNQYRLVSFLTGEAAFKKIRAQEILTNTRDYAISKEMLTTNVNMYFGIPRADGYEPYWTERQSHVWREIIGNEDPKDNISKQAKDFVGWLPLLSDFNVKYLLSGYPLIDASLIEIPVAADSFRELGLHLYQNQSVRPRVYSPERVRQVSQWDESYFQLYRKRGGVSDIVECVECKEEIIPGGLSVSNVFYSAGEIRFQTKGRSSGWVVISESHLPGWEAVVDGAPVPIRTANYLTQAVMAPAGEHNVELRYRGVVWEKIKLYGYGNE